MLTPQSYEIVDTDKLCLHPDNPRRGDLSVLADSIDSHGFYGALVVQRSSGYVLAGNHRLKAAREQGIAEVPVLYVDVDDEKARRILLVDNRASDLGGYDVRDLAELLNDVGADFSGTGYSEADLEEVLLDLAAQPLDVSRSEQGYYEATDPESEWVGMPEFASTDGKKPMRQVIISFASQADVDDFCDRTGLPLTDKTRSTWYPPHERRELKRLEWAADA